MSLETPRRVHFVGIGGAGMSAIAKVLLEQGFDVSGTDLKTSRVATMLEAMGATIHIGHTAEALGQAEVVIVSTAIPETNPEVAAARERGLEILSRGAALASILTGYRSIVISGTHGKTTTTSMVATILRAAGLDPTYLIGAGLNDIGTNARAGSSDLAVAESDESDGSFLLLSPSVAVITNIEMDHVDHWASLDDLRDAFKSFISSGPPNGSIVIPADDADMIDHARSTQRALITFGEGGMVHTTNIRFTTEGPRFTLHHGEDSAEVAMRVPGEHNIWNAVTAAASCRAVGVPLDEVAAGLHAYRGVERRFQLRGTVGGVTVIDDYAHHPTEVRATLAATRPGPWNRVIAVFQPHRFSRTAALAGEFGAAFAGADRVVLMDVYGAGEAPVPGVSGKLLVDSVTRSLPGRPVAYFPHRAELLDYLVQTVRPGDALMTLGAGDVTSVGEEFIARSAARMESGR